MSTFLILAAGNSTRFGRNKLLEKINGKTLPQIAAEFALSNGATRICLTLNRKSVITDGNKVYSQVHEDVKQIFKDVEISFQDEDKYGPGAAITAWQNKIDEDFTVLFGDNYYSGTIPELDPNNLTFTYQTRTVPEARNNQLAAVVNTFIVEKPHSFFSGRFFCGFVHFPKNFWSLLPEISKSSKGEYEITDMINMIDCDRRHLLDINIVGKWSDITYAKDVKVIEELMDS